MDVSFAKTPELFGVFHMSFLAFALVIDIILVFCLRKTKSETLLKIINILGIVMVVMEVWKQWFVFTYIYDTFSMWFFPWQLCSMPMYCSFLLPFLKGRLKRAVLMFLATFSLFSAIMALAVPSDMLRPQILFTMHGFIYHEMMIIEALSAAFVVFREEDQEFRPAVRLFLFMAVVAEIINVIGYHVIDNNSLRPDMFYITPYYKTTQVVFKDIAEALGILPEIVIYLGLIILAAYLVFLLERTLIKKQRTVA